MIATGTFSKVGLPVLASGESEFLCPMACGNWHLIPFCGKWKQRKENVRAHLIIIGVGSSHIHENGLDHLVDPFVGSFRIYLTIQIVRILKFVENISHSKIRLL